MSLRPPIPVEQLMDGLDELVDGWDSYGGLAPTKAAMATARKCLAGIHVSPTSDGGLQIDLGDAVVVIAPNGDVMP